MQIRIKICLTLKFLLSSTVEIVKKSNTKFKKWFKQLKINLKSFTLKLSIIFNLYYIPKKINISRINTYCTFQNRKS